MTFGGMIPAVVYGNMPKCECGHYQKDHNKPEESKSGFTTCQKLDCPCTRYRKVGG